MPDNPCQLFSASVTEVCRLFFWSYLPSRQTLNSFLLPFFSQSDSNASFLRAARAGNMDKVVEYLKGGIDINTCNQVSDPIQAHSDGNLEEGSNAVWVVKMSLSYFFFSAVHQSLENGAGFSPTTTQDCFTAEGRFSLPLSQEQPVFCCWEVGGEGRGLYPDELQALT